MDLPTYTNIWRIEKRLYKLYDFRLPMPLPINWIAVFTGITVPYVVLLIAIGLPFNHTLLWLYVLPPGLLTWLTTRPVIEGKRLPELVESQVRYLTEPRTWVRLTPLAEKDQMVLSARVWRGRQASERAAAAMAAAATASATAPTGASGAARGAVARRGRARPRVPAVALNAPVPVPVRDHGQSASRPPRRASGQVLTPGSTMRPRVLALGPGAGGRATPALPASRPEPRPPAPQPTPPRRPVIPAVIEGMPVRARAGALGAPPLEVSHDRPSQRPVRAEAAAPPLATRPATTLPGGNVGNTWPSPARPLRPVRTASAPACPAPGEEAPAATEAASGAVEAVPAPVEAVPPAAEAPPAPTEAVPVEAATVGETQVDVAPADVAPADAASAEIALVDPALADVDTVDAAPVEVAAIETPVGAAPEHVAPVEPAPVEPAPVEPVPVDVEPVAVETALAEPALTEPALAEPDCSPRAR